MWWSCTTRSPSRCCSPSRTSASAPRATVVRSWRTAGLVLAWCAYLGGPLGYPRSWCPGCLGDRIEWREASGLGTIYALSVQHLPATPEMADRVPYIVALVDLDEGARMMSNVFGCEPDHAA